MLQNPMMLMMIFGGLMMLAMPYITVSHLLDMPNFFFVLRRADVVYVASSQKNLDPELLQEAQQNQARFKNALQSGDSKSGCVSSRAVPYMIPDSLRKHALACQPSRVLVRGGPQLPQLHRHSRAPPTTR
jgi:hypothetical protein